MELQTVYIGESIPYSPLVTLCLTVQQLLIVKNALTVHLDTLDALDMWDDAEKIHYERALLLVDLELAKGPRVMTQERFLLMPTASMHAASTVLREGSTWKGGRPNRMMDQAMSDAHEHVERLILSMAA